MNPFYDPAKLHHRREGFQNNYTEFTAKSLADGLVAQPADCGTEP